MTMIGPAEFGSRWRKMIRLSLAPDARAASTNSFSFSESTTPRTMRAVGIQKNKDRMTIVARMLPAFAHDLLRPRLPLGQVAQQDQHHEQRQRDEEVGDPHHEVVELAAEVAGGRADDRCR